MIRALRQRHRGVICTLAVVLPAALVAGVSARRPIPVVASLSSQLAPAADFSRILWTKSGIFPDPRIIASLRQDAKGSVAMEFNVRDLVKPDVLAYWVAGQERKTAGLPGDARLLGALADRTLLPIAEDLRGKTGRFVLYSLADHEIVASSKPLTIPRLNNSTF